MVRTTRQPMIGSAMCTSRPRNFCSCIEVSWIRVPNEVLPAALLRVAVYLLAGPCGQRSGKCAAGSAHIGRWDETGGGDRRAEPRSQGTEPACLDGGRCIFHRCARRTADADL